MSISKTITQKGIYFVPKRNTQQNKRYFIYISLALIAMPLIYIMGTLQVDIQNVLVMYFGVIFVLGMVAYFIKYEFDIRTLFIGEKSIVLTTYISVMNSCREIESASFEVKWDELVSVEMSKKSDSILVFGDFGLNPITLTTKQLTHTINTGLWELKSNQQDKLDDIGIILKPQYGNCQLIVEIIKYHKPKAIIIREST